MTGFLVIADGRRVSAENGLTIGRAADCGLVLDDTKVSRHHARVVVEGGVAEIEDLGSSNGTLLNGKSVQKRVLRHGDTLQIGTTVLSFEEVEGTAAKSAPPESERPRPEPAVEPDDDVDLFAEAAEPGSRGGSSPPPRPSGTHAAPPPSAPTEPPGADQPPPPPRPAEVVEFEDEVVEVRRPTSASAAPAGPTVERKQTTLHYSRHSHREPEGGVMRDDMGQMPTWQRNLLVLLAVVVAAGLGYLAMVLARG